MDNLKLQIVCEKCGERYVLGKNAMSLTSEEMTEMNAGFGSMPTFLLVSHPKKARTQKELDDDKDTILRLGPRRGWECNKCKHTNSWKEPVAETRKWWQFWT
jgi:hypothetical protein